MKSEIKTVVFRYCCENCGGVTRFAVTSEEINWKLADIWLRRRGEQDAPTHACAPGTVGVARLVGVSYAEPVAPLMSLVSSDLLEEQARLANEVATKLSIVLRPGDNVVTAVLAAVAEGRE
jgi:hypothetical protein